VRRGRSVLVFPEGTRSKSGDPLPFKKGGFVLAIEAQVPILPVALAGTAEILRSGEFTARAGRAVVCVGRPIPTAGLAYDDREALLAKVEAEVRRLYDEAAGFLRSRT
jgi:1-acyl-sn-glycerol-3-phosphate acyltransferase